MKLSQLLKWIGFLTLVALVYIHMQMKIIHLAYEGKHREKTIRSLLEENGYLTYQTLSLKSSNHLGDTLLADNSDMDFVDSENIKLISTSDASFDQDDFGLPQDVRTKPSFLVTLLSFGAHAEAKGRE